MSTISDHRIDTYIKKAAPFAQPILNHLRALVRQGCPAATETIKWGYPNWMYAGGILCGMAAFKTHCIFGFWHQGMEKVLSAQGANRDGAMGSFGRITAKSDLPDDAAMIRFVQAAAALNASGTPARPAPGKAAKEPPVPADLAAALKKNAPAARTFAAFTPSQRKDYVTWITEAKRAETRQKRLATTLDWLVEGKKRNWKYENC